MPHKKTIEINQIADLRAAEIGLLYFAALIEIYTLLICNGKIAVRSFGFSHGRAWGVELFLWGPVLRRGGGRPRANGRVCRMRGLQNIGGSRLSARSHTRVMSRSGRMALRMGTGPPPRSWHHP